MFRSRSPRTRSPFAGRWIGAPIPLVVAASLLATDTRALPDDPIPMLTTTSHQPGDDWQEEYLNQEAARFAADDMVNAPPVVAPLAPVGAQVLVWTLHLSQR